MVGRTKFSIRLIEAPELEEKGAPNSVNKCAFDQGSTFGQKCLPDDGGDPGRLLEIWSILVYRYERRCKQSGYLEPSVS